MGKERDIADSIRKLLGAVEFDTMLCTVESVDGETTCTVKTVKTGALYKNIKLNANITEDKGIYVFPKKGSYVLVTMIDKVQGFVSMFSDIEKITLNVNGDITINGGKNDGLVIIQKLTDKINELVDWCKDHTHLLQSGTVNVAGSLGSATNASPINVPSPLSPPSRLNKSDYENEKIKH